MTKATILAVAGAMAWGAWGAPASGQVSSPSRLLVLMGSDLAPTMATEMERELAARLDALEGVQVVDPTTLLDAVPEATSRQELSAEGLTCIQGLQLAALRDVELVLCAGVSRSPGGLEVHGLVRRPADGRDHDLGTVPFDDRDAAVDHLVAAFRAWREGG